MVKKKVSKKTPIDYLITIIHLLAFVGLTLITYFVAFVGAVVPWNFISGGLAIALLLFAMPEYDKIIWRKPQSILGRNTVWILSLAVFIVFILMLWGFLAGETCSGIMGAKWSCAASVYFVLMFTVFHPLVFAFIAALFIGIFAHIREKSLNNKNNPRLR